MRTGSSSVRSSTLRSALAAAAVVSAVAATPAGGSVVLAEFTLGRSFAFVNTIYPGDPLRFDAFEIPMLALQGGPENSLIFEGLSVPAAQVGTISHTATAANDPEFRVFARNISDGQPGTIGANLMVHSQDPLRDYLFSLGTVPDSIVRPPGSPPSVVDLFGYEVTAVTRRVEVLDITPTAEGFILNESRVRVTVEGFVPEPCGLGIFAAAVVRASQRRRRSAH